MKFVWLSDAEATLRVFVWLSDVEATLSVFVFTERRKFSGEFESGGLYPPNRISDFLMMIFSLGGVRAPLMLKPRAD